MLAVDNETVVTVNGVAQSPVLNSGEYLTLQLDREAKIEANRSIQVGQFYAGSTTTQSRLDPFLLMPLANEHLPVQNSEFVPTFLFGDLDGQSDEAQTVIMRTADRFFITHNSPYYQAGLQEFPPDTDFSYSNFFTNIKAFR